MNKIFIAYLNILFWEIHVQLFYIFKLNFLFRTKLSESFIHSILNVLFVQEMYNKYFVPVLTYLSLLWWWILSAVQFSSVTQLCPTLCNPMNRSTPGLPVHHQLLEFTQTHVHWVSDAIQPSHPLSSPSPPASNPSQHQSLFQWVNSLHEVAKVLEFQL